MGSCYLIRNCMYQPDVVRTRWQVQLPWAPKCAFGVVPLISDQSARQDYQPEPYAHPKHGRTIMDRHDLDYLVAQLTWYIHLVSLGPLNPQVVVLPTLTCLATTLCLNSMLFDMALELHSCVEIFWAGGTYVGGPQFAPQVGTTQVLKADLAEASRKINS